ncbi:hypothetical protein AB833_08310 [Chromatiales bacterium (ex Bugula neritina AB1)]|nr:hypothetical protein AB833_08310 [Chromatiales bacterium (ex Bugula neritina AB1)]
MQQCAEPLPGRFDEDVTLYLAVPEKLIFRLLAAGAISASEVQCLDRGSKCCLKRLCIRSCAECLCPAKWPADF